MSRGKKTSPETIYQVMTSWATTDSYSETARQLGLAVTTVKKIVDENKNKNEFVNLCNEKRKDFSVQASEIIDTGLKLLHKRFNRALDHEEDMDLLISEVEKDELLNNESKRTIISKIRSMQLQDVKAITTAIGTLYDKRALAQGESTENITIVNDKQLNTMAELAGYEQKKQ